MFYTYSKKNSCFQITIILSSANAFNLDQSKNLSFGKELKEINVKMLRFMIFLVIKSIIKIIIK